MKKLLILTYLILISCTPHNYPELKNGDLLFVGNSSGNLSKAIDEVTQTEKKTNFSHLAILEKSGNEFWVLHAAPANGSERIPLYEFIQNQKKDKSTIEVYRIKDEFQPDFHYAIENAKTMLGKPYNFSYVLSDTAYYCSDFVFHAFSKDSIFEMNPMTFKNPGETEFNPGWIEFYNNLGMEIPEGQPGCNPNGMAASEKLIKIGEL